MKCEVIQAVITFPGEQGTITIVAKDADTQAKALITNNYSFMSQVNLTIEYVYHKEEK